MRLNNIINIIISDLIIVFVIIVLALLLLLILLLIFFTIKFNITVLLPVYRVLLLVTIENMMIIIMYGAPYVQQNIIIIEKDKDQDPSGELKDLSQPLILLSHMGREKK